MSESAKFDHRVAIFEKAGLFGSVGIWSNGFKHYVGSYDPRCSPAVHEREFVNKGYAEKAFNEHVALTVDRGWSVAWTGAAHLAHTLQCRYYIGSLN